MSIVKIEEIPNSTVSKMKPIKEVQDIYIPNIVDQNIPSRNGFINLMVGSGGSGKTSLSLGMFENKNMYRGKFDNIFYICPESSFLSAVNHPFKDHDKVFHVLTVGLLKEIYASLVAIRVAREAKIEKLKEKKKSKSKNNKKVIGYADYTEDSKDDDTDDDDVDVQYHCIFIDDFADELKDHEIQAQLSKMLIKARHVCCSYIFTLQSYLYFPKILRKQITNATVFLPKNSEEFESLRKELFKIKHEDALTLFEYAFQKDYDHLDLDTWKRKYYRNFNELDIEFKSIIKKNKN